MNDPSVVTDNTSWTLIDDDVSIMVHDSSNTTVATQTSMSWHSVVSDIHINNNQFLRPHSINTWLKMCSIEPDIRLTTAQEWKLRTCLRRLISLSNLPLKLSCLKPKEFVLLSNENESIPFIDQEYHSSSMTTLISHPWLQQGQIYSDQIEQLGLYLHILSNTDMNNQSLDAKLFEFYSTKSQKNIPLIKSPKFVFYISLNLLKLTLKSLNSLLELRFSTRENELVKGIYYKWNENKNEHIKLNITVDVDQSLINEFNTL